MRAEDHFLHQLYDETSFLRDKQAVGESPVQTKERQKQFLSDSLGTFASQEGHTPVRLERVECDGYIRERIELCAVPGLTFGAYVLIPTDKSHQLEGVIAVHGHGYGSRQICGMLEDGEVDEGEPGIYNHFAVQLVRKGMLVIAPDVIGFGERRMEADVAESTSSCYRMSTHLLMMGKTLTGLRVKEMLHVLDYFRTREEVDPNRIGIAGFSGGSLIAYVTAALDDRIRAALLIGFPNTFKASILAIHHCLCNYTPGLLTQAELPELIGLLAPRPLFLESGDRDPIFPAAGFEQAVNELQEIYRHEGAEDRLAVDLFPGKHEVSGRRSFDWLQAQLVNLVD